METVKRLCTVLYVGAMRGSGQAKGNMYARARSVFCSGLDRTVRKYCLYKTLLTEEDI